MFGNGAQGSVRRRPRPAGTYPLTQKPFSTQHKFTRYVFYRLVDLQSGRRVVEVNPINILSVNKVIWSVFMQRVHRDCVPRVATLALDLTGTCRETAPPRGRRELSPARTLPTSQAPGLPASDPQLRALKCHKMHSRRFVLRRVQLQSNESGGDSR